MATSEGLAAELYRYSLEEYHRLIEAGVFDEDEGVELLDGLLLTMSPKSRAHENAAAWLAEWLTLEVDRERYQVRVAAPLTLGGSEPEPDLAVVERDGPRPYHPASARLVVEIAASSLPRDLTAKAELYARAGVGEYWVLDLDGSRVVVHRGPGPDGWRERSEARTGDELACVALALPPLDVAALLAAAAA